MSNSSYRGTLVFFFCFFIEGECDESGKMKTDFFCLARLADGARMEILKPVEISAVTAW